MTWTGTGILLVFRLFVVGTVRTLAAETRVMKACVYSKGTHIDANSFSRQLQSQQRVKGEIISGKLGVGRQTLFRKLKDEGVTFEQVLVEIASKLQTPGESSYNRTARNGIKTNDKVCT